MRVDEMRNLLSKRGYDHSVLSGEKMEELKTATEELAAIMDVSFSTALEIMMDVMDGVSTVLLERFERTMKKLMEAVI